MIAASILPVLVLTLANQTVLILICCFAMRIAVLRGALALILTSTVLDLLTSDFVTSEIKAFGIVPSPRWASLMTAASESIDVLGESLSILGVAWLLVIVVRYKTKGVAYE